MAVNDALGIEITTGCNIAYTVATKEGPVLKFAIVTAIDEANEDKEDGPGPAISVRTTDNRTQVLTRVDRIVILNKIEHTKEEVADTAPAKPVAPAELAPDTRFDDAITELNGLRDRWARVAAVQDTMVTENLAAPRIVGVLNGVIAFLNDKKR